MARGKSLIKRTVKNEIHDRSFTEIHWNSSESFPKFIPEMETQKKTTLTIQSSRTSKKTWISQHSIILFKNSFLISKISSKKTLKNLITLNTKRSKPFPFNITSNDRFYFSSCSLKWEKDSQKFYTKNMY